MAATCFANSDFGQAYKTRQGGKGYEYFGVVMLPRVLEWARVRRGGTGCFGLTEMAQGAGSQTPAIHGDITPPMQAQDGYVWVPNGAGDNMVHLASGGCVKFSFNALPSTSVEFAFEVMAPFAADGYLCISIESSSPVQWRVPQSENWAWQTCSQQYAVAAGMHTLTIHACGYGTRLRQVRVHSGNVVLRSCMSHLHALATKSSMNPRE